MARNNWVTGRSRGKIGSFVGGGWRGIDWIRAYVIPRNPRTQAQLEQRARFKAINNLVTALRKTGNLQFMPHIPRMTPANHIVRVNRHLFQQLNIPIAQVQAVSAPSGALSFEITSPTHTSGGTQFNATAIGPNTLDFTHFYALFVGRYDSSDPSLLQTDILSGVGATNLRSQFVTVPFLPNDVISDGNMQGFFPNLIDGAEVRSIWGFGIFHNSVTRESFVTSSNYITGF